MNFALMSRLRMIDFLLDHYGYFNRSHLMDFFGLSVVQVSKDIAEYKSMFPGNCVYDTSKKQHVRADTFKRNLE